MTGGQGHNSTISPAIMLANCSMGGPAHTSHQTIVPRGSADAVSSETEPHRLFLLLAALNCLPEC